MSMGLRDSVIGIDFGTSAVRAVVVDPAEGRVLGSEASGYAHGTDGVIVSAREPLLARQHPTDYIEAMATAVRGAVSRAQQAGEFDVATLRGMAIDATGSTPLPVDRRNTPLAMLPQFADDPDAMAWLWKDHTSHAEAAEITSLARRQGRPYLGKCGGTYSSEWYWSKILRCTRVNPRVAEAAASWVELCDWIPSWLCGVTDPAAMKRSVCAAGHKGMYSADWGGLPAADFLSELSPGLSGVRKSFATPAVAAGGVAGTLAPEAAAKLGLGQVDRRSIPVAIGAIDAHQGAVGSGCAPGTLVKIIGTSTCDCVVVPLDARLPDIPGVCGIVPESILPGHYGIEAGQSAVGDIFNWFVSRVLGKSGAEAAAGHAELSESARRLSPGESGLMTLDWHNGNRTVLVDPLLSGMILGLTLASTPAEIYHSLIEATAFGARVIIERLSEYGVTIDRVVCCGGVAEKSPLLMQIYADVLNRPMHIARSDQACALGSAVIAAVVGGVHPSVLTAQGAMTATTPRVYQPRELDARVYDELFDLYRHLHDAFGTSVTGDLSHVMKRLLEIKERIAKH